MAQDLCLYILGCWRVTCITFLVYLTPPQLNARSDHPIGIKPRLSILFDHQCHSKYIYLETSQSIKARTSSFQSLKWQCKLYTIHWQFRLIFKCINTWMHNLKALTTWMQHVQSMRHIKAMHNRFNQDQWCKQLRQYETCLCMQNSFSNMMPAVETFYSILQHIHADSSMGNTQDNAINKTWDSGTLDTTHSIINKDTSSY